MDLEPCSWVEKYTEPNCESDVRSCDRLRDGSSTSESKPSTGEVRDPFRRGVIDLDTAQTLVGGEEAPAGGADLDPSRVVVALDKNHFGLLLVAASKSEAVGEERTGAYIHGVAGRALRGEHRRGADCSPE